MVSTTYYELKRIWPASCWRTCEDGSWGSWIFNDNSKPGKALKLRRRFRIQKSWYFERCIPNTIHVFNILISEFSDMFNLYLQQLKNPHRKLENQFLLRLSITILRSFKTKKGGTETSWKLWLSKVSDPKCREIENYQSSTSNASCVW